jgi:hypothetical protein
MVIPKVAASPNIVNFEVLGPCGGTAFNINIACPTLLTGFSSSVVASTSTAVCELEETVTYYNASLADTPGTVGLYDFVFSDAYGASPLAEGFYLAAGSITGGYDWFEVDENGIVIDLGVCSSGPYAFSMLSFGTDTDLESCADWVTGDPPYARVNRYSTGFTLSVGDIIYTDSGLTTPLTWPVLQYYGYAQPIPSGGIFRKWCKVDTDGTVLEVDYCS